MRTIEESARMYTPVKTDQKHFISGALLVHNETSKRIKEILNHPDINAAIYLELDNLLTKLKTIVTTRIMRKVLFKKFIPLVWVYEDGT